MSSMTGWLIDPTPSLSTREDFLAYLTMEQPPRFVSAAAGKLAARTIEHVMAAERLNGNGGEDATRHQLVQIRGRALEVRLEALERRVQGVEVTSELHL